MHTYTLVKCYDRVRFAHLNRGTENCLNVSFYLAISLVLQQINNLFWVRDVLLYILSVFSKTMNEIQYTQENMRVIHISSQCISEQFSSLTPVDQLATVVKHEEAKN